MPIIIALVCLAGSLITAVASAGQKISVENKGTYIYWLSYTDAGGAAQVSAPARFKGDTADVELDGLEKANEIRIYVLDKRTGNLAIGDVKLAADPKEAKPIEMAEKDFAYVPVVRLKVVSEEGNPLESALVTLTDGEGTVMQRTVTPADAGVAAFSNVAAGDVDVKVDSEGAKKTLDSNFDLPLARNAPAFEKKIRVSGDVATLPVVKAETGKQSAAKPAESRISGIAQGLVGLVLLAMIVAIVYVVIRSRGFTAEAALRRMGVEIPDDRQTGVPSAVAAAPEPPVIDPSMCPFCGLTKDAAGQCACSIPTGGNPVGGTSAAVGMQGPRLVGVQGTYMGAVFPVDRQITVGRDQANEAALPNDTTASRRHATITPTDGGFVIRDEGSSNGTFVNGARIAEQRLTSGDEVQIGGTRFRFEE